MSVSWEAFEDFSWALERYMPEMGQGETMASQAVTATNKLIYKWYNDGDVFDNTAYLSGWCNNLSSYANWLAEHISGADAVLSQIYECHLEGDYEDLLFTLAWLVMGDEDKLEKLDSFPAVGDIYDCPGNYRFDEPIDDDEDEWEDDEEWYE